MSRMWQLQIWDDLDGAKGIQTPADVSLSMVIDGRELELDLTQQHYDDFMAFNQPYFDAARKGTGDGPVMGGHGEGVGGGEQTRRQFLKGMRDWADERGRSAEYKAPGGGFYYKRPLREDYERWLTQHQQAAA